MSTARIHHVFLLLLVSNIICIERLGTIDDDQFRVGRRCGTVDLPDETLKLAEEEFQIRMMDLQMNTKREVTSINVFWHVISDGPVGNLTRSQIEVQLSTLNHAYINTSFSFNLASVDYISNAKWFSMEVDTKEESDMKRALHVGTARDLNYYSTRLATLLGWSTLPASNSGGFNDGIVFDYRTLPGGSFNGFNMGATLIHETGHWLGLYHTFQGGCGTPGDYVSDTPSELKASFGCPLGKDSCPNSHGEDPIHNYMDYTDDACMYEFTVGQSNRMKAQFAIYRNVKPEESIPIKATSTTNKIIENTSTITTNVISSVATTSKTTSIGVTSFDLTTASTDEELTTTSEIVQFTTHKIKHHHGSSSSTSSSLVQSQNENYQTTTGGEFNFNSKCSSCPENSECFYRKCICKAGYTEESGKCVLFKLSSSSTQLKNFILLSLSMLFVVFN